MRRVLLLVMLGAAGGTAQTMDATHVGDTVRLQGNWRFRQGDDPSWGKVDFNDSDWRLVSTEKNWDQQGLQHVRGYFWYRTRVMLPAQHGPLELLVSEGGPYELYINGVPRGVFGRFPPQPVLYADLPQRRSIPDGVAEITLALKVWASPIVFHVDNVANDMLVGTKDAIERRQTQSVNAKLVQQIPDIVIEIMTALLSAGLLLLFYLQRERTEYLFLALAMLAGLLSQIAQNVEQFVPVSLSFAEYWNVMTQAAMAALMIDFLFRFLGQPTPGWLRVYQISMGFLWILVMIGWSGWMPSAVLNVFFLVYFIPYWFSLPGVLFWRFARGNKEAGLLAIPLSLLTLDAILSTLGWLLFQLRLRSTFKPILSSFQLGIVAVGPGTLFIFLFLLSIGALILMRFQKTRADQARAHAELEAARSMQEVMVPKSINTTGFQIETAYIPAAEVGGDFFQLFPGDDGSLLVVIGDVSGKGMKAAMLVSMILGLLRRTVAATRSPAQVLHDVNALLIGHADEKFATCCCALISSDGTLTAANAGHLSPYCEGSEIELPGGLPLGLSAAAAYDEVRFELPPGKRLVFLSDGVVEARSKSGELYGFERTRTISIAPVKQIALTAQLFGQEDDITVLGIQPEPAFT